jgi:putative flippase GtrA
MKIERFKEIGKFMGSGIVATTIDYTLLNALAVLLGLPVILANSISASISSFVSYKINKNVVFEDRMHGRKKTFVLYVSILAFGILVLQNGFIHLLHDTLGMQISESIRPLLEFIRLGSVSDETVGINAAKVIGSLFGALWNYFMLRRFVFVTQDDIQAEKNT